jgi:hypothetical protein
MFISLKAKEDFERNEMQDSSQIISDKDSEESFDSPNSYYEKSKKRHATNTNAEFISGRAEKPFKT